MTSEQAGTDFTHGHIHATSQRFASVEDVPPEHYDLVIVAASWDSRCAVVTTLPITADQCIVIHPPNTPAHHERIKNEQAVMAWLRASCQDVSVLDYDGDLESALGDLAIRVRALMRRPQSRVLIDMSACARFLSLGILWLIQHDGVAATIDILYAEGDHTKALKDGSYADSEEDGWSLESIPGYEGDWYPTRPTSVLISAGFDASRVSQILELNDVSRIGILFGIPGVLDTFEGEALARNKAWIDAIGQHEKLNQSAGDAIAVWRELVEWGPYDNIRALLGGPKAHSLGVALACITTGRFGLLYLRPDTRRPKSIGPLGPIWRYRLRDRSALVGL